MHTGRECNGVRWVQKVWVYKIWVVHKGRLVHRVCMEHKACGGWYTGSGCDTIYGLTKETRCERSG